MAAVPAVCHVGSGVGVHAGLRDVFGCEKIADVGVADRFGRSEVSAGGAGSDSCGRSRRGSTETGGNFGLGKTRHGGRFADAPGICRHRPEPGTSDSLRAGSRWSRRGVAENVAGNDRFFNIYARCGNSCRTLFFGVVSRSSGTDERTDMRESCRDFSGRMFRSHVGKYRRFARYSAPFPGRRR